MSIWERERIPGAPARFALGAWLTYRKLASAGYLPGERSRQRLRWKTPLWYPLDFSLSGRASTERKIVTTDAFELVAIMATATQPGNSFRAQLYDAKRKLRLADTGMDQITFAGTAQQPFFLRSPYFLPLHSEILCRVADLSNVAAPATNDIQIVLFGYGE